MKQQAYAPKNEEDFDNNTSLLHDAIDKISSNRNLKATKTEICRLTGMHRNSLKDHGPRGWVAQKLEEIKRERKVRDELAKHERKDQLKELESQLDKSCKEVVLWFSKFDALDRDFKKLDRKLEEKLKTLEWYKSELKKEREKSKSLNERLEQLNELLREK